MKKFVLIPDSFKGTMSSAQICRAVSEEIHSVFSDASVQEIPVADGGEGTVDAFLTAVGGQKVTVKCKGPYMEDMTGFYGLLPDGTAVVEMAAAAGLPLVGENRHAEQTTTYGVGELIAHAVKHGAKRVVLGLGGSATNDGGCGSAAALGVKFLNAKGETFVPVGGTLNEVVSISASDLLPELKTVPVTAMCDIDNPLCQPIFDESGEKILGNGQHRHQPNVSGVRPGRNHPAHSSCHLQTVGRLQVRCAAGIVLRAR